MRTALWMLLWLGVMTAVATVVPQAPNVPGTVESWLAGEEGPGVGVSEVLLVTGAFDVYGSPAFLALLLALFLSLTACLIPRIRGWITLVRRSQPPLLRVIAGDHQQSYATAAEPAAVLAAAREVLGVRVAGVARWRVREGGVGGAGEADVDADGGASVASEPAQVAAETGLWSREGGSLMFHLSFYVLLAAVVFGQLLTFEGQRGVIEREPGFVDAAVSYWSYAPGRWFAEDDHAGWRMELDAFDVDWIRDPLAPGAGQPTLFRSDVTVTSRDGTVTRGVVEGNKPLVVDGRKIHQLDWGYAARVVVRQDGRVVHDAWATTQDAGGVFTGAVKAPAAVPDVGLELLLYPFAPDGAPGEGPRLTGAPWAEAPLLFVVQWRGDLQLGVTQQFINELDVSALDLDGLGWLRPGDTLAIGDTEVEFVDLRRWVGFQVSYRPQLPWLLAAGAMLSLGLITALYAYRRRLWVVVTGQADGRTLYAVVGRAFQRPDVAEEEFVRLSAELAARLDAEPVPTPGPNLVQGVVQDAVPDAAQGAVQDVVKD
jgi:cytochrome c biogenesis protein